MEDVPAELLVDHPVHERAAGKVSGTFIVGLAAHLEQTDKIHRKVLRGFESRADSEL